MQTLFSLLIGVHAAIHLLGFLHAFQIQEFPAFSLPIPKAWGLLWLVGALTLGLSLLTRSLGYTYWWGFGLLAVLLSQLLIFTYWQDAKFGTIPNLLLLIVCLLGWTSYRFAEQIKQERILMDSRMEPQRMRQELDSLPLPVQRWLQRSGVGPEGGLHKVYLEQELKMKLKPEQTDWAPAVASQYFTVNPPAFNWAVDLRMNPLVSVRGRDQFGNGQGGMQMKIWSAVPVVNVKANTQINEAALQRFLAEIVWFPAAARSPYLEWEALDNRRARATMRHGGTTGSGIFHFDEAGDFSRFTAMRYKDTTPEAERYEWVAEVRDYGQWENLRIPTRLQLSWKLPEGDFTWLEVTITDLQYNSEQADRSLW